MRKSLRIVFVFLLFSITIFSQNVAFAVDEIELILSNPNDNVLVVSNGITVKGTVRNADRVTVNGIQVRISETGTFSRTIGLNSIKNEITVIATNTQTNNMKILNRTVYYSFPPTIEITSHDSGMVVNSPDIILGGDIRPFNQDDIQSFTVNGSNISVRNGEFTSSPIILKDGINEIKLTIKTKPYVLPDGRSISSREVSKTFRIEYKSGTSLNIYEPDDEEIVYSNQVTVRGKVGDPVGITKIKVGDKEADLDKYGYFSQEIALKSGKNEIKVTFSDGSKGSVTETIIVYSNILASDGSKMVFDAKDGQEIKAFNDALKVKLAKNSIGTNTKAVIKVQNAYLSTLPSQTAKISPTFHIDWDGDQPLKPYKVTIKYDEVVKENQAQKVTLLFYDDRYTEWKTIGGLVDPKNFTVSAEINKPGYVAAALSYVTFGDITYHWAKKDIEFLAAKGAIQGRSGGQYFQPDSSITRAEFVVSLAKTIGLLPHRPIEASYYDVPSNHWAYEYIEAASRAGIISGSSYRAFAPNRTITREEAAAILVRAGNVKSVTSQELSTILGTFKDADKVSGWAKQEVAAAVKAKIINGNEKMQFLPKATTTRAQAVTMIARLYESTNKTK